MRHVNVTPCLECHAMACMPCHAVPCHAIPRARLPTHRVAPAQVRNGPAPPLGRGAWRFMRISRDAAVGKCAVAVAGGCRWEQRRGEAQRWWAV